MHMYLMILLSLDDPIQEWETNYSSLYSIITMYVTHTCLSNKKHTLIALKFSFCHELRLQILPLQHYLCHINTHTIQLANTQRNIIVNLIREHCSNFQHISSSCIQYCIDYQLLLSNIGTGTGKKTLSMSLIQSMLIIHA